MYGRLFIKLLFLLLFLWSCDSSSPHLESNAAVVDRRPPGRLEPGGHLHVALFSDDLGNEIDLGNVSKGGRYAVSLEMKNLGEVSVSLSQVKTETKHFEVQVEDYCLKDLKPKESCHFKSYIYPNEIGETNGFISFLFESLDGQKESVGVAIKGFVVSQPRNQNPLYFRYLQSDLNIGKVPTDSYKRVLIELVNPDEVTRTLEDADFSKSLNEAFSFSGGEYPGEKGTCSKILKTGKCLLELEFAPKANYRYLSILTLSYNDMKIRLNLTGNGIEKKSKCNLSWQELVSPDNTLGFNQYEMPFKLLNKEGDWAIDLMHGTNANKKSDINKVKYNKNALAFVQFPQLSELPLEDLVSVEMDVSLSQYYDSGTIKPKSPKGLLCFGSKLKNVCSGLFPDGSLWKDQKNTAYWDEVGEVNHEFYFYLKYSKSRRFEDGFVLKTLEKRFQLTNILGLEVDAFRKIFDHSNSGYFLVDDLKWENDPRLVLTFNREVKCASQ